MRILFFTHYFPPEGNAPASRTYENCKRWVKEGHQVTVITCAPNVPDGVVYEGYKNSIFKKEDVDGINVIRVWTYIAANKGTLLRIMNYISYMFSAVFFSLFIKRPDIIIGTSPQFFCGWAGILSSKLRWVPSVLEIRDIWPETIIAVGAMKNQKLLKFLEWLELKMYRWADFIVTVGDGYRQDLLKKDVPDQKIDIVMNGVDQELFYPREPKQEFIDRFNPTRKIICSYIGTIGMTSGLDVVVRAAEKLKESGNNNIQFLLVGDGAERQRLQEEINRLNLENIILTGRLPKQDMPEVLAVTNVCLVHLKKKDLFKTVMPSKIFEAAGMAKPIINGVDGFAAKIIEQAGAGINFEPENEDQLIEALNTMINNPEVAEKYAQSGYKHITEHYNRDLLAEKYIKILEKVKI